MPPDRLIPLLLTLAWLAPLAGSVAAWGAGRLQADRRSRLPGWIAVGGIGLSLNFALWAGVVAWRTGTAVGPLSGTFYTLAEFGRLRPVARLLHRQCHPVDVRGRHLHRRPASTSTPSPTFEGRVLGRRGAGRGGLAGASRRASGPPRTRRCRRTTRGSSRSCSSSASACWDWCSRATCCKSSPSGNSLASPATC